MDKQLNNFINQAKDIKMTMEEKSLLRSVLVSLPTSLAVTVKSPYVTKAHFWTFGKALIAACLIIVLSGGSLSYAAEKSLPGELLHPIKTEFNEEVVSMLKIKPEEKLAWQEKRMERRVKEIEELRKRGKFNERAQIQIEKSFDKQIRKVEGLKVKSKIGPQVRADHARKNKRD